jgi:predicted metal-binding membrane protein
MRRDALFIAAVVLAFAGSSAATVAMCRSMSGGMPMPGGWTMSMAWMRMPGQGRVEAGFSFTVMWLVMMIAMMVPALSKTLLSYRNGMRITGRTRVASATVFVAAGYFAVWAVVGVVIYPLGALLASLAMKSTEAARAVPAATGLAILFAGVFQLTRFKARQLRRCCYSPDCCETPAGDPLGAFRNGLRSGVRCTLCCAGLMLVLLVAGVMNLGAMTAVAIGITAERVGPAPVATARVAGFVLMAIGAAVMAGEVAALIRAHGGA